MPWSHKRQAAPEITLSCQSCGMSPRPPRPGQCGQKLFRSKVISWLSGAVPQEQQLTIQWDIVQRGSAPLLQNAEIRNVAQCMTG
eukprot:348509-Pyramimonas_sp.AAC.1